MSFFEKNLTILVFLCIVLGLAVGHSFPGLFQWVGSLKIAEVNIPVAILIWLMIIPMLMKIDFRALHEVRKHIRGISITLFINWLVKPFGMAFLAWLFIKNLFAGWLPTSQIDSYIAGLILLAAAPCTAMVFVWSELSDGEPHFTLSQVALNDVIMIFAFGPIVGLLLGMTSIHVPWKTLLLSVVLYIVIPVIISQIVRYFFLKNKTHFVQRFLDQFKWLSPLALLLTLILIFSLQGKQILTQPVVIGLLAIPILIQVYFNSLLAYWLNKKWGEAYQIACPSALIGASNFFELAVATAISLFGFESGATLATVVGVLIEVPVMLSIVRFVKKTKNWYGVS